MIVMPICKSEDGIGILMTVQKEAIEVDEDQQFVFKIANEQVEEELNDKYDHFYDLFQAILLMLVPCALMACNRLLAFQRQ